MFSPDASPIRCLHTTLAPPPTASGVCDAAAYLHLPSPLPTLPPSRGWSAQFGFAGASGGPTGSCAGPGVASRVRGASWSRHERTAAPTCQPHPRNASESVPGGGSAPGGEALWRRTRAGKRASLPRGRQESPRPRSLCTCARRAWRTHWHTCAWTAMCWCRKRAWLCQVR